MGKTQISPALCTHWQNRKKINKLTNGLKSINVKIPIQILQCIGSAKMYDFETKALLFSQFFSKNKNFPIKRNLLKDHD